MCSPAKSLRLLSSAAADSAKNVDRDCAVKEDFAVSAPAPFAPDRLDRRVVLLVAAAVILCAGWFWWLCERDPEVPFLPTKHPGEWIVYPMAPNPGLHGASRLCCVFRRRFDLQSVPSEATLRFRSFRNGVAWVNAQQVGPVAGNQGNWKQVRGEDVTKLLRTGQNEISVAVTNDLGPPAVWAVLELPGTTQASDKEWEASMV